MIWILISIAIILGVLLGVWFTKLPIKYRILEKTNELGETYYYPQYGLLFWNNFDDIILLPIYVSILITKPKSI